jgi:arylsulfatase A-like enzyme
MIRLLAGLLAAVAAQAGAGPLCDGCNVMIISVDPLRADSLGVYGSTLPATPHIDALGRRGQLFTRAYSQSCITLTSHLSAFTGLYPDNHGVFIPMRDRLPAGVPTLGAVFRGAGYRTLWAGPKGPGSQAFEPPDRFAEGFETVLPSSDDAPREVWDWAARHRGERLLLFLHSYRPHGPAVPRTGSYRRLHGRDSRWTWDRLQALAYGRVAARPELIFRPEGLPRFEAVRRMENDAARWSETEILSGDPALAHTSFNMLRMRAFWEALEERPDAAAEARRLYDAVVAEVDDDVGRIVSGLSRAAPKRPTVVVLLSHHGEEFREHGDIQHWQPYEEVAHVPLLFVVPGQTPRVVPQPVQVLDLAATLTDLVGIRHDWPADGASLAPLLAGQPGRRARPAFTSCFQNLAIRDERFTFIHATQSSAGRPPEFYRPPRIAWRG